MFRIAEICLNCLDVFRSWMRNFLSTSCRRRQKLRV